MLNSYRRLGLQIVKNEIFERREDILVKDSDGHQLNYVEQAVTSLDIHLQTKLRQMLRKLEVRAKKYGVKFPSVILLIGVKS